ncbi:unnamed protein product [Acanthoscelides obtectus]|uniref:Uncharacterized protein n=1 Tax=Acanthoscelides obtectus TaxID=200917 RepID=A0A9P0PZL4_ACAOB|nr:unnamed protein product [Acanthoscelides obtectus]CAK1641940.1 hypothetical protein AOBTE_LOCUS12740 [Acanthoscelides obtectus]
MYINLVHFLVI